jgi:hypothetical protein
MPVNASLKDRKRAAAIQALMTEPTLAAAAAKVGVSESALIRWKSEPEFKAGLQATQAAAVDGMVSQMVSIAGDAVAALRAGLGEDKPIHIRLRATDIYLGKLLQLRQMVDFEQRLLALEERANEVTA